jgi:UPF0176 protein
MSSQKYKVLLFYKYINFENPEKFREEHFNFCEANNILGRIFIAEEGINGTVSGLTEDIEKYKIHLRSYHEFEDIIFKEDHADEHAFYKLHVRVKKEIVNTGRIPVNLKNGGKRLKPDELKSFYESGKEFIIVDARNNYESVIGRFKNAVTPDMDNFREWPEVVESLKEYKDKTVVTYCTGGIRCEKASAYMVEQGFKDVYQLDGGIVTYTKQFPDTFWEGSVFVFDERRIVSPNSSNELKDVGECYYCGTKTSYYINCHNQDCDKIIVTCHSCKIEHDYCCSDECRNSQNKRSRYHG